MNINVGNKPKQEAPYVASKVVSAMMVDSDHEWARESSWINQLEQSLIDPNLIRLVDKPYETSYSISGLGSLVNVLVTYGDMSDTYLLIGKDKIHIDTAEYYEGDTYVEQLIHDCADTIYDLVYKAKIKGEI